METYRKFPFMPSSGVSEPVGLSSPPNSSVGEARKKTFLFLILISLLIWYHPIISTVKLAIRNDAYTYVLIILPIFLALIFSDRRALHSVLAPSRWLGSPLIGSAVLLRVLGEFLRADLALSVQILGLVLFWIGTLINCFGVRVFRWFLFPFCVLFLLVPLPQRSVESIRGILQNQSAAATTLLFRAAGVPVARDDVKLSIPGLDIEVARECSSIRSSTMLVVVTLVLAYLFLTSWWRRTLLVGMSLLLSVAKNALRMFVIAELATRVDRSYLYGRLHHQGGVVFLVVAIAVEVLFLWTLRTTEVTLPIRADIP